MPALSDAKTERPPLDPAAIACGVRRVEVTHDGRKIGHVEPLETERALRLAINRRVHFTNVLKQAQARESNRTLTRKIGQAQKQSATKRAKGKGKRHG
jgi:hypothetical protein